MANASKMILNIILFVLISQGYSYCTIKNLRVRQVKTGATVKNKPEWKVTITNTCPSPCVIQMVYLKCVGFQTVEPVPTLLLAVSPSTGTCLLAYGQPISANGVVTFKYAWDNAIPLLPNAGLVLNC
ncbi:hypothetical protein Fmac_025461 [Flemingia macrophylla]|uniref:Uncharacterized protein n=1 Tax=Flemingia macrophylla TaxID=520843 RepID=A0ABD1LSW1_9FABA